VTACFKLMKALQPEELHPTRTSLCEPCVYFSKNLDKAEYPAPEQQARCGLDFLPGDTDCAEMRTDNCSTRKR
jgi:hypothetical protein